ncbi:MAG: divalent metal cation transporter [Xanthobacteraceae bacterium]|nr:MAG: divalent metal cation transporter [Xanthobacteraceae bacterium]
MRKNQPLQRLWSALGPGLITGAADDDPSGIATYSQAGAQFGYALTWTRLLTFPFMVAIQIISACIGWQTRKGLAGNIAQHLPPFGNGLGTDVLPQFRGLVRGRILRRNKDQVRKCSRNIAIACAFISWIDSLNQNHKNSK